MKIDIKKFLKSTLPAVPKFCIQSHYILTTPSSAPLNPNRKGCLPTTIIEGLLLLNFGGVLILSLLILLLMEEFLHHHMRNWLNASCRSLLVRRSFFLKGAPTMESDMVNYQKRYLAMS